MGQGSDSCGTDVEYDAYDEGLERGVWIQRNGVSIHVSAMSVKHLYGAKQLAVKAARRATFTDESDKWEAWVEVFDAELARRERPVLSTRQELKTAQPGTYSVTGEAAKSIVESVIRGLTVTMICHCNQEYQAREADIKRGWGLSCSKRCAAIRREFGRPAAKRKHK